MQHPCWLSVPVFLFFHFFVEVCSYLVTNVSTFNLTDRCEGVSCKPWEKCIYDSSNGARCVCRGNLDCPADFQPVCGSDANRYNNYCIMKATACRQGEEVEKVADGSCTPGMHVCWSFCYCRLYAFFSSVLFFIINNHVIGFYNAYSSVSLYFGLAIQLLSQLLTGAICQIIPASNCRAYFRNFYFNLTTNKCESIIAGGCHPSGWNGFTTMEDCNRTCSGKVKY